MRQAVWATEAALETELDDARRAAPSDDLSDTQDLELSQRVPSSCPAPLHPDQLETVSQPDQLTAWQYPNPYGARFRCARLRPPAPLPTLRLLRSLVSAPLRVGGGRGSRCTQVHGRAALAIEGEPARRLRALVALVWRARRGPADWAGAEACAPTSV